DGLGDQHGIVDSAIVEALPECGAGLPRTAHPPAAGRGDLAFALLHDELFDVLKCRILRADLADAERQIALGVRARRTRIVLTTRPPDADDMIHRKFDPDGFLEHATGERAPTPHEDPVWPVLAESKPRRRRILQIRQRRRIFLQRETVIARELS